MNDNTVLWWVIKGPVVGSIMVSVLGTKSWEETGDGGGQVGKEEEEGGRRTNQLLPFSWLHSVRPHGYASYLAVPLVLGIYLISPIVPPYERCC